MTLHVVLTQCWRLCLQVKSIFVGGLPATVNEDKLQEVFKAYGEVCSGGDICAMLCMCCLHALSTAS